jgi:hypothetical protein
LGELGRGRAVSQGSGFQTVASIDVRSFGIWRRDMASFLLQLEGKAFTLNSSRSSLDNNQ